MKLTPVEQGMYEKLLEMPDCAPLHILKEVRPPVPKLDSNIVAVHIKNLRRKLRNEGLDVANIHGYGYKLVKFDPAAKKKRR